MKNLLIIGCLMLFSLNAIALTPFEKKNLIVITKIVRAADFVGIPRELLLTICFGESNFKVKGSTHIDGGSISHSVCQVKLATAQHMDQVYRLKIPATSERLEIIYLNAFYAAKLLKYQLNRYDDNWKLAVDAYNKGTAVSQKSGYVKRYISNLKFILKNCPSVVGNAKL